MSDPVILFVKPGAVSKADRRAVSKAGVVVVEVDEPSDVKLLRANAEISSTEMLACAAKAIRIGQDTNTKIAFANAICQAVETKQTPAASSNKPGATP